MSLESAVRREMTLSDWTLVLGLPESTAGFRRATAVGEYCLDYADWSDYEQRFVRLLRKYFDPLEQAGLNVVREASLRQFGRRLKGSRGVVLISHCNHARRTIEFQSGMATFGEIAATIDGDFHGIVDVSVCAPNGIHESIKGRAPHCAVRSTMDMLRPAQWLPFHAFLLSHFGVGPCSYAQALLATTQLFAPKDDAAPPPRA